MRARRHLGHLPVERCADVVDDRALRSDGPRFGVGYGPDAVEREPRQRVRHFDRRHRGLGVDHAYRSSRLADAPDDVRGCTVETSEVLARQAVAHRPGEPCRGRERGIADADAPHLGVRRNPHHAGTGESPCGRHNAARTRGLRYPPAADPPIRRWGADTSAESAREQFVGRAERELTGFREQEEVKRLGGPDVGGLPRRTIEVGRQPDGPDEPRIRRRASANRRHPRAPIHAVGGGRSEQAARAERPPLTLGGKERAVVVGARLAPVGTVRSAGVAFGAGVALGNDHFRRLGIEIEGRLVRCTRADEHACQYECGARAEAQCRAPHTHRGTSPASTSSHGATTHLPATHACPIERSQVMPQPPQLCGSLLVSTSQPSDRAPLQSA